MEINLIIFFNLIGSNLRFRIIVQTGNLDAGDVESAVASGSAVSQRIPQVGDVHPVDVDLLDDSEIGVGCRQEVEKLAVNQLSTSAVIFFFFFF